MREFSTALKLSPLHAVSVFVWGSGFAIWSTVLRKQYVRNTGFIRSRFSTSYEMKACMMDSFEYSVYKGKHFIQIFNVQVLTLQRVSTQTNSTKI